MTNHLKYEILHLNTFENDVMYVSLFMGVLYRWLNYHVSILVVCSEWYMTNYQEIQQKYDYTYQE